MPCARRGSGSDDRILRKLTQGDAVQVDGEVNRHPLLFLEFQRARLPCSGSGSHLTRILRCGIKAQRFYSQHTAANILRRGP